MAILQRNSCEEELTGGGSSWRGVWGLGAVFLKMGGNIACIDADGKEP